MLIYKKQLQYLIPTLVLILFLLCGVNVSASSPQNIKVYNKGEEVILSHELFCYNEQYYLHLDDLPSLNLDVSQSGKTYTVTSSDCLGVENLISFTPASSYQDIIITPLSDESASVKTVTCNVTNIKRRSSETLGNRTDIPLVSPSDILLGEHTNIMIKVNNEFYISAQFIGNVFSHKYSLNDGKMDFYTADDSTVITETTIKPVNGAVAPSGGYNITLYTAYKTGSGDTIDSFEILSQSDFTIPENKSSADFLIETPTEKINGSNIYFIVNFGKKYEFVYGEYDFSKVGKISAYVQQKEITYTVNVNLPQIDEQDIPFTIYVQADNSTLSKKGVIKSGENSLIFEFEGIPAAKSYNTRIEFDYHKYKNAVLEDFDFIDIAYAKDFKTDFSAEYSRSVVCNISLPEDFIPEDDIEVKVELSKYVPGSSLAAVDKLTDWSDSKTVTLGKETVTKQICLYSQSNASQLSYKIIGNVDGVCRKGYLDAGGKTVSSGNSVKKITEDLTAELKILKSKAITVTVYRPASLSDENDIFASVVFDDKTHSADDIVKDYTKTPLIAAGERKTQIEIELAEDKLYSLKINDITGDERLFNYYCFVSPNNSPADNSKIRRIRFSNNDISLTLLQCNNICGTVKCEKSNLDFDILASCNLYNGGIIYIPTTAENGNFSLKIPEDTDTYTLDIQTSLGKKSYYVSDGVSTNNEKEAAKISFEYNNDKTVVLEYILQKPTLPVKASSQNGYNYFMLENISDYPIEKYDAYVAYYDKHGSLLSVDSVSEELLPGGMYYKLPRNTDDYRIKKAKAFVWRNNGLTPLGNTSEINVNQPELPEQSLSVFKADSRNAIINSKAAELNTAPKIANNTMYVSATDFEKMGYTVVDAEAAVYIEKDKIKYKFEFGEYTAVETEENINLEISAPILKETEILIPLSLLNDLFDEKAEFNDTEKTTLVNMPFNDIKYGGNSCDAVLDMYYKGIMSGYEDGSFQPDNTVMRSEAAVYFSRAMGHDYSAYDFECSDVDSDNWAKSMIGICINENVFELEDNKFRPNDKITLKESVKAVLAMTGNVTANYFETAEKLGLLTNINTENAERNITRTEAAQLLYNFFTVI